MNVHDLPRPTKVATQSTRRVLLPALNVPPPSQVFTAGEAEAVNAKEKTMQEALDAIAECYGSEFDAMAAHACKEVAGEAQKKQCQLEKNMADLKKLESVISQLQPGDEVDVHDPKPLGRTDQVELAVYGAASVGLVVVSIYANQSFLAASAVVSGPASYMLAALPMVGAFVAKEQLKSIASDLWRRRIRHGFAFVAVAGVAAWMGTFAHEAGAPVEALTTLNQVATADHSLTFSIRSISQIAVEVCGGAILFNRVLEIARNEGAGKVIRKVYALRERYQFESKQRAELLEKVGSLQQDIKEIETWLSQIPFAKKAFVGKAIGQFQRALTALKD